MHRHYLYSSGPARAETASIKSLGYCRFRWHWWGLTVFIPERIICGPPSVWLSCHRGCPRGGIILRDKFWGRVIVLFLLSWWGLIPGCVYSILRILIRDVTVIILGCNRELRLPFRLPYHSIL